MKALIGSLWRHQFFTLSSGVIAAQVLSLLLMPLLTRLYPVEAFGFFAIYLATTNLIGLFSTLRLEQTIPIASDQTEADHMSSMTMLMSLVAGGLAALAFALPQVRGLLPAMNQDYPQWGLMALSAIFMGWIQILTQRILRNGKLKYAAIRHICDKGSFLFVAILAAKLHSTTSGLIFAQTIGNGISCVVLMIGCSWKPTLDWTVLRDLTKKYSDFPRLNSASIALQLFATQLPILIYSYYFSPQVLGYLNLAQRLADAPNTVVSGSLAQVYYRRLLTAAKYSYRRIFLRTTLWSGLAFVVPAIAFSLFAETIISHVFGLKWQESTPFFLALAPLTVARLSYTLQQSWLIILRRLDIDLKISAMLLTGQALGIALGIYFFTSLVQPVMIASLLTAVIYLGSLYWIYRLICESPAQVQAKAPEPILRAKPQGS